MALQEGLIVPAFDDAVGGAYELVSLYRDSDGKYVAMHADASKNLNVNLNTLINGEDPATNRMLVEMRFSYANIITLTTTVVKSGAGFFHALVINTKGATASTATIYDNTAGSGTKIGTVDVTANVGTVIYDVMFSTGLTIVTATGTAGDLTVAYR